MKSFSFWPIEETSRARGATLAIARWSSHCYPLTQRLVESFDFEAEQFVGFGFFYPAFFETDFQLLIYRFDIF